MLDLLQEALLYIEKQSDWIIQLKSTIVEKEKTFNEMHSNFLTRIYTELHKQKNSEQSNAHNSTRVIAVKMEGNVEITKQKNNSKQMSVDTHELIEELNKKCDPFVVKKEEPQEKDGSGGGFPSQNITCTCTGLYKSELSNKIPTVKSELEYNSENTEQQAKFLTEDNLETSGVMDFSGSFSNGQMDASSGDLLGGSLGENEQVYATYRNATGSKRFKASPMMSNDNNVSEEENEITSDGNNDKQVLNCPACKASFGYRNYIKFQSHLLLHSGGKVYDCSYCGQKFSVSENLILHIRNDHPGENSFTCLDCKHTFLTQRGLRKHKANCFPIGKAYYSQLEVRNQSNCVEMPADSSIAVPAQLIVTDIHADHLFDYKSLRKIDRLHTVKQPFNCTVCKQPFRQLQQLNNHRCYSDAETPFKCDLCKLSFSCWKYYICHNQQHHKDILGYDFSSVTTALKFHVLWK